MQQRKHTGPLVQRIAPPVYSLLDELCEIPGIGGGIYLEADQVLKACLLACAEKATLKDVTVGWETPDGRSFHNDAFNKRLSGLRQMPLVDLDRMFQRTFGRQAQDVLMKHEAEELLAAIDYHEREVYLKNVEKSPLAPVVVGRAKADKYGKKKKKTHVLRFLTVSIVRPFHRVVAARFVGQLDDGPAALADMVNHLSEFGIRQYLMDRGFYSYDVLRFFERSDCQYLMPVPETDGIKPILSSVELDLSEFEGTYLEFISEREYTLVSGEGRTLPLSLDLVVKKRYMEHLRGQHFSSRSRDRRMDRYFKDPKLIAFATNITGPITAKMINELYKDRWLIETGYRTIDHLVPRSPTKSLKMRVFWFYLACALDNIWEKVRREMSCTEYMFRKALARLCELSDRAGYELVKKESHREVLSDSLNSRAQERFRKGSRKGERELTGDQR
jgi:hypothetical protein